MSGIETIENFGLNRHMYGACNVGNFVAFQAQSKYALALQQDTKLVFRREVPGSDTSRRVATCASLGVLCYAWRIQIPAFGTRTFEPCWKLVHNIYAVNVSKLIMYHTAQPTEPRQYHNEIWSNYSSTRMWFSSDAKIPLDLIDTARNDTKEVDKIGGSPPDFSTIFVLVPTGEAQYSSMHLSISSNCRDRALEHAHNSAGQGVASATSTGIVSIAMVARPALFTLHAIFSDCTEGCSSGTVVSLGVYVLNFLICSICLLAVHTDCATVNLFSGLFVFSLSTSIITLNWVAVACICSVYLVSGSTKRRVVCALHIVQFVLILREMVYNQLGTNSAYILSTHRRRESGMFYISAFFLPFTALDQNLYLQNCALYLITGLFNTYLLYFKIRGIVMMPVLCTLIHTTKQALRKLSRPLAIIFQAQHAE